MQSPPFPRYLVPPKSKYSPQHHVLRHPQLPSLPQCQRPSFTPIQNNLQNYSSNCPHLAHKSAKVALSVYRLGRGTLPEVQHSTTRLHLGPRIWMSGANLPVTLVQSGTHGVCDRGFSKEQLRNTEQVILNLRTVKWHGRSQWPRGLRRWSAATRLLRLWVRIPPGAWMSICCEYCVLSGRGICDELITRLE